MSRRDTIIVAVLINAGLLIVLFASALKSKDSESSLASNTAPNVTNIAELPVRKDSVQAGGDEVDQVLNQFSRATAAAMQPVQAQTSLGSVNSAQPQADKQPIAANFADDLKAITMPDSASAFTTTATTIADPAPNPFQSQDKPVAAETEIKVKKGDVLDKIARNHQTSVEEIMKLNGLNSTRLKIGQPLRIPGKTQKVAVQKVKATAPVGETPKTDAAAKFYTVKNGDNPWTIAVKNHMKVDELLKLNNLNADKARHLKPGDQLRIR
jgi:LysM repeat protein